MVFPTRDGGMGLDEITDVIERTKVNPDGTVEDGFDIRFRTESTTGFHTVFIPDDEFDQETARERARSKAKELDAVVADDQM